MKFWTWALLAAALVAAGAGFYGWRTAQRVDAAIAALDQSVGRSEEARERMVEDTERSLNAAVEAALQAAPRNEVPVATLPENAAFRAISVERVVDGDTLIAGGVRYRLANVDAPGLRAPDARCEAELQLGKIATARVGALVEAGAVSAADVGRDQYGRTVAFVRIDAADLGETLVSEGLARRTDGAKFPWCNGL